MFDLSKSVEFVQTNGNDFNKMQLAWIVDGIRPSYAQTIKLFEDQRRGGGFAPYWATEYSSVDATCYRLAQAESLGMDFTQKEVSAAITFLIGRQTPSGKFSEDLRVAEAAPNWIKPGDPAGDFYLTANAGFWLAQMEHTRLAATDSAGYLKKGLKGETGQLPSFLNTYWLAGALWWMLDQRESASLVLDHLKTRVDDMPASNLTWMLNTFRIANIPADQIPIPSAIKGLKQMQEENGRFPSNEGQDVQVTLDALQALKYFST